MKQPTVLIIDDEKVIRDGFKRYLEDLDYRVLEAENGRAGLEVYEKQTSDLTFCLSHNIRFFLVICLYFFTIYFYLSLLLTYKHICTLVCSGS